MGAAREESPETVGQAAVPAREQPSLSKHKRRLPHWRFEGSVYHARWRLAGHQRALAPEERVVVVEALREFDGERYELRAFVVMDDHVHALVKPIANESLLSILHSRKSFTAHRLQREFGRVGRVWQAESFDRIVRGEREYWRVVKYILENPRRRWRGIEGYEWVGVGTCGRKTSGSDG